MQVKSKTADGWAYYRKCNTEFLKQFLTSWEDMNTLGAGFMPSYYGLHLIVKDAVLGMDFAFWKKRNIG